jgi:N-acyl-D-amino-acid deacylase
MIEYDTLITGGTVIDGSGAPRFAADLAVDAGRIAAIGTLGECEAREKVDARGMVVAPGFVDVHTHDDRAVLESPALPAKVSQGVTTVVTGNCGISLAPLQGEPPPPLNLLGGADWYRFASFADYLDELAGAPAAVNVAPLVGHSTLRTAHMDDLQRPATPAEISRMCRTLGDALEAGAIGLSTGLAYPTASAASTDEVVEIAVLLADRGGIYTTHMRDEADQLLASVEEALVTGERAGVPVVISHHKACGRRNWGRVEDTLALIGNAQGPVAFDVYPYVASSTVLLADFLERAEKVVVTWSEPHPECAGMALHVIAEKWGCDVDAAVEQLQPAGAIYYQMHEQDLQRVLSYPGAMIGSDGLPHDRHPHPRLWGTFPRVLGHYCRELGLFTLEEAVHRMTGRPARVFGLRDRGTLAQGNHADITVFDAHAIIDTATFEHPTRTATGIQRVWSNGACIWRDGQATGARPGRTLSEKLHAGSN